MENVSRFNEMFVPQHSFLFYLEVIVNSLLFLFGVPGNCLILRVYWTKTRKTSTHVLIMALAWADLAVCTLRIPHLIGTVLAPTTPNIDNNLILRYIRPTENATVAYSALNTGLIALDRYDCICRAQSRFFTPRRSKIAVFAAILMSVAIVIPSLARQPNDWSVSFLFYIEAAVKILTFLIVFVVIVFSYGNIYKTVRKHVRVAVDGKATGNEYALRCVSKRSVKILDAAKDGSNLSTPNMDKAASCLSTISVNNQVPHASNQPGTSQTNPGKMCAAVDNANTLSSEDIRSLSHEEAAKSCLHLDTDQATLPGVSHEINQGVNPTEMQSSKAPSANGVQHAQQRPGAEVLQQKTTRMLFITSVVFTLAWLPYVILICTFLAVHAGAIINSTHVNILCVLTSALYINSAVNPLIYGLANRRFRQDFRNELRRIRHCLAHCRWNTT